jgi:hypothetical protein
MVHSVIASVRRGVRAATVVQRPSLERGNVDGPRGAARLGDVLIEEEVGVP